MRILNEPVLTVNPQKIAFRTNIVQIIKKECADEKFFEKKREAGVYAGDWDLTVSDFRKHDSWYKALEIYRAKHIDIYNTADYKYYVKTIGELDAKKFYVKWIEMYEDIKKNGYIWRPYEKDPWDEYILIDIGRTGKMFLHNGRHRLAACLFCGVKEVPVKTAFRHPEWIKFKDKIAEYTKQHYDSVYSPLEHPDLACFKSNWSDLRPGLILKHINKRARTIVDLGAHWGHVSFQLAKHGFVCHAVERDKDNYSFLEKLNTVYKAPIRTHCKDVLSVLKSDIKYDCLLALNIFHHYLNDKQHWDYFVECVKNIQCNEVFLQLATNTQLAKSNKLNYKKDIEEAFAVFRASGFVKTEIGKEHERSIYRLTR